MKDEAYTFALKTALDEMQNICPDIKTSFIFSEDGEIVAGDEKTPQKLLGRVVDSFEGILDKSDTIGGLEGLTVKGDKGTVNISAIDDLFFLTVTKAKADTKYVNAVTHVLIPTIMKLLTKIQPTPLKAKASRSSQKIHTPDEVEEQEEILDGEDPADELAESEEEPTTKTTTDEPLVNQLVVEDLGGLLIPSDTIRIDSEIISQWEEHLDSKRIDEVQVETFSGKATLCRVKPIKDSKYTGKGIIRIPEKIQASLDIGKGELVRVRPAVT